MKKVTINAALAGLLLASVIFCPLSRAHDLWATMDDYTPDKGASASLAIFNSHRFPADAKDYLAAERLEKALFITPSGRQVAVSSRTDGTFGCQTALTETGTYLAIALPRNGFATKTTEGYQRGKSKKDLENVIECRYSQKFAKTVFTVGKPGGETFSRPLGHAMEIVPLKNPALVKTGQVLPVKALVDGKPARTIVYGTYAGFSESPNTFAYTTRTDKEGVAEIRMIHNGVWVLIAKREEAYPDAAECDKQAWAASLTFEIH